MPPPLSHAHLPSSDAKLDRWGWNEVCQMQLQWSHLKCISLIGLIPVIYHIILFSFSFGCVASNIMCHWQWQPNSVKLMTGLAYILNLISNNIRVLFFSNAALCTVWGPSLLGLYCTDNGDSFIKPICLRRPLSF